jgi:hypothetical protein
MLCTNGSGRFKCTWVVSKLRARRDGGVEARDFKGGVAGRGAIALRQGRRGGGGGVSMQLSTQQCAVPAVQSTPILFTCMLTSQGGGEPSVTPSAS